LANNITCDLLITHGTLVQVREGTGHVLRGQDMATLPVMPDAYVAITNGIIADYGPMHQLPDYLKARQHIVAKNRFVFPAFVDAHTHLVFAEPREEEFVMKIKGATYAEIAARGGGILNSVRKLQKLTEDELLERTLIRAREIIRTGTGVVEIKSGYGLTTHDELKMLRVARRLGELTELKVKTTFLGAHAVPEGMPKEKYVAHLIEEMIPAVAEQKLADYIDVFCETGFFTPDEAVRIAEAGKKYGMKPRLHANQLGRSGGVQAGVAAGAISVDHLEHIGDEEISLLQNSNTLPVALPGAAFFLRLPQAPGRTMIDAGLPLVIASDFNPGSSPTGNMPLMVALACIQMRITPEEAINAATFNAACALELQNSYGSITRGKVASLFITTPMPSVAFMPYAFGSRLVDTVILNGKIIPADQPLP
jgi:imidazolonepropionase